MPHWWTSLRSPRPRSWFRGWGPVECKGKGKGKRGERRMEGRRRRKGKEGRGGDVLPQSQSRADALDCQWNEPAGHSSRMMQLPSCQIGRSAGQKHPMTHCLVHGTGPGSLHVGGQAVPHSIHTRPPSHTANTVSLTSPMWSIILYSYFAFWIHLFLCTRRLIISWMYFNHSWTLEPTMHQHNRAMCGRVIDDSTHSPNSLITVR